VAITSVIASAVASLIARAGILLFPRLRGAVKAKLRAVLRSSGNKRKKPISRCPDAIHQGTFSEQKEKANAAIQADEIG